jgi:hypothetical protein
MLDPIPLNTAPEITSIQQGLTSLTRKGGVTRLLVTAALTLDQGKPLTLYCDLSQSFTVTLPPEPVAPNSQDPGIQDYYEIVTLDGGGGSLTIALGDSLINGSERESIVVPPGRSLKILFLGGAIGWLTDRVYTNAAIGKTLQILPSRPPDNWTADQIIIPDNLDRATDGDLGTETGSGRTQAPLSNLGLYLDFAVPQEFSRVRVTGRITEAFGRNESAPVSLILWTSFDLQSFDDFGAGDFYPEANETLAFTVTRSGALEGRYIGLAVYHVDRFYVDFVIQEMEVS